MYARSTKSVLPYLLLGLSTSAAFCAAAVVLPVGNYAAGKYQLSVMKDGHYRVQAGKELIDGSYTTNGDEVVFDKENGSLACDPSQGKGTYRWTSSDETLSFSKITDDCQARVDGLTSGPWKKKD